MKKIYVILALCLALNTLTPLLAASRKTTARPETPPPPPSLTEDEDVPPPPTRSETPPPPPAERAETPPPPAPETEEEGVVPPPPAQTAFDKLMEAIRLNDMSGVNAAFKAGADINEATSFGYTPLEYAVVEGNVSMVERLLREKPILSHTIGKTGLNVGKMAEALAGDKSNTNAQKIVALLETAFKEANKEYELATAQAEKLREEFLKLKAEREKKEREYHEARQKTAASSKMQDPYSQPATDNELLEVLQAFDPYESMLSGKRNPEPATYAKKLGVDEKRIKAIAKEDDNPAYVFLELYVGKGPLTPEQKRKVKAALTYFVVDKDIKKWFLEGWRKGIYNDLESLPAMSFFYWVEKNDSKQAAQELKAQARNMISK